MLRFGIIRLSKWLMAIGASRRSAIISILAPPMPVAATRGCIPSGGYDRQWVRASSTVGDRAQLLRVVQFNILADGLSGKSPRSGGFMHTPPEALEWTYRRDLIIEEVFRHFPAATPPDVVAMQEVDHYDELLEIMASRGYAGTFLKKPDSPCKRSLDPSLEDGCALFWRRAALTVEGVQQHQYVTGLQNGRVAIGGSNQVAILAALRRPGAAKPILVGVTHLSAEKSSEGERSRVAQVGELCAWLQAAAERWDAAATVALLDMNGAPRSTNNKYEPAAYPAAVGGRLRSAYQLVLGAEPAWTTWKRRGGEELKMTLDYVLVSPEVTCHRVLLPPDDADVDSERLPGWRYPSDHVMLAAELSVADG